jgi:putative ABC transport system permease protein
MTPVKSLGLLQVLLILLPVVVVLALSVALRLGQTRIISIATARAVVQLLAVGMIIGWVFRQSTWYWILGLLAVMLTIASLTAARRFGGGTLRGAWVMSLVLGGVTGTALLYFGKVVVGLDRWDPRYLIPLGGMMLGNAMTAAMLAVERVTYDLSRDRADVEAYLALGASPAQAAHPAMRRAVAAALTPTLNAMMVMGVVKLPGMMTGQILGGSDPFQAAVYQLLILTGILFGDSLAATFSALLWYRRLFTPAWQLDHAALARLKKRDG